MTNLEVDIGNHCGRLIANVVIAYNSILMPGLLTRYLAAGNDKAIELLRRISPAAWQFTWTLLYIHGQAQSH